jgi:hypothetical protein
MICPVCGGAELTADIRDQQLKEKLMHSKSSYSLRFIFCFKQNAMSEES